MQCLNSEQPFDRLAFAKDNNMFFIGRANLPEPFFLLAVL